MTLFCKLVQQALQDHHSQLRSFRIDLSWYYWLIGDSELDTAHQPPPINNVPYPGRRQKHTHVMHTVSSRITIGAELRKTSEKALCDCYVIINLPSSSSLAAGYLESPNDMHRNFSVEYIIRILKPGHIRWSPARLMLIPPPLLTQYKKYYLEFFREKQSTVKGLWNSF